MSSSPGGISYSSGTMTVGDATWSAERNSYLLPNLQGLNFDTMRYNGMGNRFKSDARYQALIIAHAVIAALVFLLITPLAVFIAKFYHADGRRALRLHVTLQVTSTILLIVAVVLAVLAVGRERALSNPHHGIGLAILVAVLLQAIGGGIIRQTERRKVRPWHLPVRIMLHKWFGRAIVALGIAQVALGLTLYGAPLWTFIIYAIVVGVWLALLFYYCQELQYSDPHPPEPRSSRLMRQEAHYQVPVVQSRGQQQQVQQMRRQPQQLLAYHNDHAGGRDRLGRRHHGHHRLRDAALGVGAAGAYHGWRRHSRDRSNRRYYSQQQQHQDQTPPMLQQSPTTPQSHTSSIEDKSPLPLDDHTWRNRVLGAGAGVAAAQGARSLLHNNRRDYVRHSLEKPPLTPLYDQQQPTSAAAQRSHSPHVTFATPPHSSQTSSTVGTEPADRMYRDQTLAARRLDSEDGSSIDYPTGIVGTLAAITGVSAIRQRLRDRQDRREQDRLDEMTRIDQYNAERLHRSFSRHEQRDRERQREVEEARHQWEPTSTLSTFDGSQTDGAGVPHRGAFVQQHSRLGSPYPGSEVAAEGTPATAMDIDPKKGEHDSQAARARPTLAVRTEHGDDSSIQASPIPLPAPPTTIPLAVPVAAAAAAVPVAHAANRNIAAGSQPTAYHMTGALPAAQPGQSSLMPQSSPVPPAPPAPPSYTQSQSQVNDAEGSIYSGSMSMSSVRMTEPPVSVKVRIHDNQRHVTMRKLNAAEIAAERIRQQNQSQPQRRNSGIEIAEFARAQRQQGHAIAGRGPVTPTPYIDPAGHRTNYIDTSGHTTNEYLSPVRNADGYSSPGTGTSESSAFEQNRRRRRAERTSPQTMSDGLSPRRA